MSDLRHASGENVNMLLSMAIERRDYAMSIHCNVSSLGLMMH